MYEHRGQPRHRLVQQPQRRSNDPETSNIYYCDVLMRRREAVHDIAINMTTPVMLAAGSSYSIEQFAGILG